MGPPFRMEVGGWGLESGKKGTESGVSLAEQSPPPMAGVEMS